LIGGSFKGDTMVHFKFTTVMGKITDRLLFSFLSSAEVEDFNSIGCSGKTLKDENMTGVDFLNSLGKGQFSIIQVKHDTGDFVEEFVLAKCE
jgi:hypothetical protein